MPRLSIDIDLTYIEISDRESSFDDIIKSLKQIKARLNEIKPDIVTEIQEDNLKLLLSPILFSKSKVLLTVVGKWGGFCWFV